MSPIHRTTGQYFKRNNNKKCNVIGAEAEIGALYLNAREAVYLWQILVEMGHPQPPTPIQTDNTTSEGLVNHKIQPKRTKAMDMCFHWLRDSEQRKQFRFYWRPGGGEFGRLYDKTSCASPPPEKKARILNEGQGYPRRKATSFNESKHSATSFDKPYGQMKLQGCVRLPKYGSYILA
jgi:hypothetical protein